MRQSVLWLVVSGVLAVGATSANAQTGTWADRGYVNIGFGVESGSSSMKETQTINIYEEAGTITSSTSWTSGFLFDAGLGVRVWRNMTIGVGYHQDRNHTDNELSGEIPSPVFFNRPRNLTVDPGEIQQNRRERAAHLVIGWVLPISEKFDILVSGGPSFFRLEQEGVEPFTADDIREGGPPFTSVSVDVDRVTHKKSLTGYNVGVDGTYILWSNDDLRIGAGGFFRFTQAKGSITMLTADQDTEVGGMQFGFGARIRF